MSVPWSFSQTTTATSTSTTASSPSSASTPPNFIDWLHISPVPHDHSAVMMTPFQDLSSSARINRGLQEPEHCLRYLYNISDFLGFNMTPPASVIPTSLSPPVIFNSHHRMLSLDSTTTNLINTPSSGSPDLFSPIVPAVGHRSETPQFLSSSSTSLFTASKFIEDLQTSVSPFGNYFRESSAPFASSSLEDISPVIRADTFQESLARSNKLLGLKKNKSRNKRNQTSSFVQKLRSVPSPRKTLVPSALDLLEEPIVSQRLLSPCKLLSSAPNTLQNLPTSPLSDVSGYFAVAPLPLAKDSAERDISSPLTPLTPLSSSPGLSPPPPLKIVLKLKRRSMDELPITPPRRSKRPRRTALVEMGPSPDTEQICSSPLPESSPEFNPTEPQNHRPVYTNRKLPPTIQISVIYPLFYRRFPASRHYQMDDSKYSPFIVSYSVRHESTHFTFFLVCRRIFLELNTQEACTTLLEGHLISTLLDLSRAKVQKRLDCALSVLNLATEVVKVNDCGWPWSSLLSSGTILSLDFGLVMNSPSINSVFLFYLVLY